MIVIFFLGLVVFVWVRLLVIFVLVLFDHGRRARLHRAPPGGQLTDVTIVIPALQEANNVVVTVHSVRRAIEAGAALIVVDDGSTDCTPEIVREALASIGSGRLIRHERNMGKHAALNTGVREVKTPFVLTLDADTVVDYEAIELAVEFLRCDNASTRIYAVVGFDVSVKPSASLFSELQAAEYDASLNFERRGQAVLRAVSVAPGAASLWRVEDLDAIGGFSAATVTEDVYATLLLAARGRRAAHIPGVQAFTTTPRTFAQLAAQRRRWCLGHYQSITLLAKHLGHDAVFTALTYPNFVLLSAFMPLTCMLSAATLFVSPGVWMITLAWLTAVWLVTVYIQRFVALWLIRRRVSVVTFLLEPFSTQLVHLWAMISVIHLLLRQARGVSSNVWATRAR